MKRSAIDVVRRGFENLLANWPLILIRVGEGVLVVMIIVAAIVAAIVPMFVSAGLSKDLDIRNPDDIAQFLASLLIEHWILILYVFGLAFVLLGVLIAVHSFVEAGSARVYIDGERTAGFRAFDIQRWLRGGADGWWPVFWIYNFAWSVGALVLLLPAMLTLAGMLAVSSIGGRLAIGCSGLAVIVLLAIPIGIATGIWVHKAIAVCVARGIGAVEALRAARREIKLDFGRHLAVGLVLVAIGFGAAMVVSGVSFPLSIGDRHTRVSFLPLFFAPMQIMMSMIQSAVSAAISGWTLASFVALTEER